MTQATGTSGIGAQLLLNNGIASSLDMSITLGVGVTNPPVLVGYYWLYMFLNASPFTTIMVAKGNIYKPGIAIKIPVAPYTASYQYQLQAQWKISGLAWTATIV